MHEKRPIQVVINMGSLILLELYHTWSVRDACWPDRIDYTDSDFDSVK